MSPDKRKICMLKCPENCYLDAQEARISGRCSLWQHCSVAMVGLGQFILKNATLTNDNKVRCLSNQSNEVLTICSPKLVESLKCLTKFDPMVLYIVEESGEYIIARARELHLEICLKDLRFDGWH
jgi:hypothetical protein